MTKLPKVVASSVIRSSHQGESHGGLYVVDIDKQRYGQIIDWDTAGIDWTGRGGDRGLRGIAIHHDKIYLAASNELFVYDNNFQLLTSYQNRYFQHCHEISIYENFIYLTSTGFDSILVFDLLEQKFTQGYCFRYGGLGAEETFVSRLFRKVRLGLPLIPFDPTSCIGPIAGDTLHINQVQCVDGIIYFSGVNLGGLYTVYKDDLKKYARIPFGTHNAQAFREGVLMNDTRSDRVTYRNCSGQVLQEFNIKRYSDHELSMRNVPEDHARQAFGRGLVAYKDFIIGGSSPATISVYRIDDGPDAISTINLTMDVRNAIHGLEIWPY